MATSTHVSKLLEGNARFTSTFMTAPPTMPRMREMSKANGIKGRVILSCMDPRVIPEKFLGLENDPMAVLRNAGGRAVDAIKDLYVLNALIEVGMIAVVHHTDCGLTHVKNHETGELAKKAGANPSVVDATDFGEINDLEGSIREDVEIIKNDPIFGRKEVTVLGLLYETETGKLREIV